MGKIQMTVDKENLVLHMERVIHAPLDKVWQAHADPELVPKWWGPRQYTTTVAKMDFREGGAWRFVHEDKDGEYAFRGEYKEIAEHDHITWTFEYEGMPGHILTETIYFKDLGDGTTQLRTESHYASLEDLEGMLETGMEGGANESWDRLEELTQQ